MQPLIRHRSAGIVVVRREAGGWKFLVLRAWREWGFPKGLVEPGETLLAAAQRETAEETGLRDLAFRWGQESIDTEIYGDHKIATYFLAATDRRDLILPVNPELGHPEHDEYRWVSDAEAQALLPRRLQPVLAWARARLAAG